MKKVIPVSGDIMYDNLGIGNDQLEEIYNEVIIIVIIYSTKKIKKNYISFSAKINWFKNLENIIGN